MSTQRFVPVNSAEIKNVLKNIEAFVKWAKGNNYNALVFPMAAFASYRSKEKLDQLKLIALENGITLEAGGWELSSLVPRKYFFFHKDAFRMEEGKRKKDHHFCPTSLNAIKIIGIEGKKLFQAASGIEIFHLWPDNGAETAWCSCPTCRAFSVQEQTRIAVNAAADVLTAINPSAVIGHFENSNDPCNISLRKNIVRLESLCIEKIAAGKESFSSNC